VAVVFLVFPIATQPVTGSTARAAERIDAEIRAVDRGVIAEV
jgi:hypothetical protein